MSILRFQARALIGAAVIADGVDALRRPAAHEQAAAPLVAKLAAATDRDVKAAQAVRATGIGQAVGGGLIAASVAPRLGALVSLLATVPAALFGYRFWEVRDDPVRRAELQRGFFAHLALAGGALLVLAGPTRSKKERKGKAKGGCCARRRRHAEPAAAHSA
jgi:uncharacterized membrane protein YphA (DoxX/SURF4 family)